jgi:tetratricopeptide (TPR) repeat protein
MHKIISHREQLIQASRLIRNGNPAEAILILNCILEIDPDCSFALKERGYAKLFSGDHRNAIADFTEMIYKWPAKPEGFTLRASAYESVGELQRAIEDYTSAITIDPKHPYAYLQRGRIKVQSGDLHGAIFDFSSDMEFSKEGRLSGLLNRGRTKHQLGDLCGAISDLTEAFPLEIGKPVFAPLFRGRAKLAAGDYNGAISDFTAAIEAFPQLTNAYRHRAEARTLAGDKKGADDDLASYNQLVGHDLPAYS